MKVGACNIFKLEDLKRDDVTTSFFYAGVCRCKAGKMKMNHIAAACALARSNQVVADFLGGV